MHGPLNVKTHLIVRATHDELKSLTKIIPQGNLTSDSGISFTVHTTVIMQTCSIQRYTTVSTQNTTNCNKNIKCMTHGQWSPCYDLLMDWVKKHWME